MKEHCLTCECLKKTPIQDSFSYPLKKRYSLWLCVACEKRLRQAILEQINCEKELSKREKK